MIKKTTKKNQIKENVRYVDFSQKREINKISKKSAQKNLKLEKINSYIKANKPSLPVYFYRPECLRKSSSWFLENFVDFFDRNNQIHRGEILYSVKSNPEIDTLKILFQSGIEHYDVASLNEIKLVSKVLGKKTKMYFMHPVKPRESIKEAYEKYGIRDFSLDSEDELIKILECTNNAKDLNLHVRLAIPNLHSAIDLSGKFGIRPVQSADLLKKVRLVAKKLGICFHVGSQCMEPTQYRSALMIVKDIMKKAQVKVDVLDIGGGFPSIYPGMNPPALSEYIEEIRSAIAEMDLSEDCKIWCEPGRAIVAEAMSLLVRVEGRKENMLYINDGTYGGLFDAGIPAFIYPAKTYRLNKKEKLSEETEAFGFYGPTCDSMDVMKGPFYLPKNIQEGDYIEIGQLGSYSKSLRTDFNGFNEILEVEVSDKPLMSLYHKFDAKNESFLKEEI